VTLRRLLPGRQVTAVHSPNKPVIGVGESTTAYLPVFLHRQLALDRQRFYAQVQPSWKLGIRFVWGPPEVDHFNYPFGFELSERVDPLRKRAAYYCLAQGGYPGPFSSLMDHDLSPCVVHGDHYGLIDQPFGYHIDNKKFLAYLDGIARELGVEFVTGDVVDVTRDDSGNVRGLTLEDGRDLTADLFVDCSGFGSLLLGKTLGERFVDYGDTLLCDSAVVGGYDRDGPILPYTTAETMDHGWCWRIDLPDRVTLGYVHSSQFCTPEDAMRELRGKKPELGDDLRMIRFPSGRYENYWTNNVVAIGNASGFVEPLESTALHVIAEQLIATCAALLDSDYRVEPPARDMANQRFRQTWDSIRDFLAVHYKFNHRLDTPFWRHCREKTCLGDAQPVVDMYQKIGPHQACKALIPRDSVVQFEGYLALLMGQRVATDCVSRLDHQDLRDWEVLQEQILQQVSQALPVREALRVVNSPAWSWSG
jgi:tryptophan halogenase